VNNEQASIKSLHLMPHIICNKFVAMKFI